MEIIQLFILVLNCCFILHNIVIHLQDDYDVLHDSESENMQAMGVEQVNTAGARQRGQERRDTIARIIHGWLSLNYQNGIDKWKEI
ncbi:hypothetical protein C0J52_26059 [Blattella germanica]|nr:hypothetical protein C0J52_26059 [Blattella germanica]